ncbi:MAG: hypothetical protein HQL34_00575 [Alphaproteobacteria bacterium]|nr:hypothetical protein [Alphaproteobacteria bacterium]
MKRYFSQRLFAFTGAALLALSGGAVAADWVSVGPGCRMWNPFPERNESFVWNGKCENGLADGPGNVIEKNAANRVETIGYGTWTQGKLHGDYYYEKDGFTCYEQKFYGVAKQTLCVGGDGRATLRAVDNLGRAVEPMRPLTPEETALYSVVLEKIATKGYIVAGR